VHNAGVARGTSAPPSPGCTKLLIKLQHYDATGYNIDERQNILVGPNGVGKTNPFLAVRAVHDALTFASARQAIWANQQHRLNDERPIEIGLDLEFDSDQERAIIAAFFAASFCNDQAIRQHRNNINTERLWAFSESVKNSFRSDTFPWIYRVAWLHAVM